MKAKTKYERSQAFRNLNRQASLQRQCDRFNARHPVGTEVHYHPIIGGPHGSETYRTSTPAQLLSGHTPVVWLEGKSGCVALSAVTPANAESLFNEEATLA